MVLILHMVETLIVIPSDITNCIYRIFSNTAEVHKLFQYIDNCPNPKLPTDAMTTNKSKRQQSGQRLMLRRTNKSQLNLHNHSTSDYDYTDTNGWETKNQLTDKI